jgi:hypothetical protein
MRRLTLTGVILAVLLSGILTATAAALPPEFLPGAAKEKFTGKTGKLSMQVKEGEATNCMKSEILTGNGELLGLKTALIIVDASECKTLGLTSNSLGDNAGVILMHFEAELCYIDKAKEHVGLLLKILPLHFEIPSTGLLTIVEGSFIILIRPVNVKTEEFKLTIEQTSGVQTISKCEGAGAVTLSSKVDGAAAVQTGVQAESATLLFAKAEAQTLMA